MTRFETLRMIKNCPAVFVGCIATPDDVKYFKVSKKEATDIITNSAEYNEAGDLIDYRASVFTDGNLYIA